jgi:hypothetical protein
MKINICIFPAILSFDQLMRLRFRTLGIPFSGLLQFDLVNQHFAERRDLPETSPGSGMTHCAAIATYNAIRRFYSGERKSLS